MEDAQIAPKDRVMYVDPDGNEWGPWRVVRVLKDHLVIQINEEMQYTFAKDRLQKV